MIAITCKNCGNYFQGNFCNQCGERAYNENNKSIVHFFEESFHFLTHLDNKFLKSVWLVFTKPGFLSYDISIGIRKKHFKPVNLFLLGVILYLLFPFFQGLNLPLKSQLNEVYGPYVKMLVNQKTENKMLSTDEIAKKYDAKSPRFAKILLLVIIPITGLALSILFYKKGKYYFDHFTLAAELNTFYLYFTFFIIPLVYSIVVIISKLFYGHADFDIGDEITFPLYLLANGIFATSAFMRFYKETMIRASVISILYLVLHMFIVYAIYRLLLISVVFLFI